MSCQKHGYDNPTFCPACDMEVIEQHETLMAVADAIDAARYAHPQHPRERPRPFTEADPTDFEYAVRLAKAAIAALTARQGT